MLGINLGCSVGGSASGDLEHRKQHLGSSEASARAGFVRARKARKLQDAAAGAAAEGRHHSHTFAHHPPHCCCVTLKLWAILMEVFPEEHK